VNIAMASVMACTDAPDEEITMDAVATPPAGCHGAKSLKIRQARASRIRLRAAFMRILTTTLTDGFMQR
jgi:hypothetical protein